MRSKLKPAFCLCFATVLFCQFAVSASIALGQDLNWAEKMFEKRSHDFGVVATASDVSYRFKITNIYQQQVHISSVDTTCGCSAAAASKTTLGSREEAYVEVTMDTRKFKRKKDSNLIVKFDAPLWAEVRIPISAYIRTDVVVNPGAVQFGAVDHGTSASQRLTVAYAGRRDWTIKDVLVNSDYLEASVKETNRSAGQANYELTVNLKPNAPPGALRRYVTLVTDDRNSPHVPVLVQANIEADITITPSIVALGTLIPGQTKSFNVVLRGKEPFEIQKIECGSSNEAFAVRLPKEGVVRQVHVLPLTVTTPSEPGQLAEEFSVTIAGRPDPVVFKALGQVAKPEISRLSTGSSH
jgi:hypothetical protein